MESVSGLLALRRPTAPQAGALHQCRTVSRRVRSRDVDVMTCRVRGMFKRVRTDRCGAHTLMVNRKGGTGGSLLRQMSYVSGP